MSKGKVFLRIASFLCIFLVIFCVLNILMQPIWREWNNYNTIYGFYEEPKNTIEVVFLGSSTTANGYVPMQLYEDYGICAYNFGTEQQPMLASYYWLEEAYRLHPESLKVVIANPSMLRRVPPDSFYRKALDGMRFSSVKLNALRDYLDDPSNIPSYLISLLSYHDRWSSLEQADFEKFNYEPDTYTRGYHFVTNQYLNSDNYDALDIPSYHANPKAGKKALDEEGAYYLDKMIDFCREHSIKLIWVQTPDFNWSSGWHNTITGVMEEKGLEFYDLNYLPYIGELDYNTATDNVDRLHENYSGASKITDWIGRYLTTECDVTDVRGDEKYAFMESELEAHHSNVANIGALKKATDPAVYLSLASQMPNCTVFVSVKDEAAQSLTQEQRDAFAEIGLSGLSALTYRDSYLAVLNEGTVAVESVDVWNDGDEKREAISASGEFGEGNQYKIVSGGYAFGNKASIQINGSDKAANERGLNIVVYNCETEKVVDATAFDTCASSQRIRDVSAKLARQLAKETPYDELSGDVKKLYLYNRRCENSRLASYLNYVIDEIGPEDILEAYGGKEGYTLLISMYGDAAGAMDSSVESAFARLGLAEFADADAGASYVAVVDGEAVVFERRERGEDPISASGKYYDITCGGSDSKKKASIRINGKEYAKTDLGINIVVYDQQLETVVNQGAYDMSAIAGSAS